MLFATLYTPFAILFAGTFLLMLVAVPVLSRVARRYGLVDRPDQTRKLHGRNVPLVGGVAILVSLLVTCGVVAILIANGIVDSTIVDTMTTVEYWQMFGLFMASLLIVAVGVLDDRFGMRGRQKLFAQLVASAVLVLTGTWVQSISLSDGRIFFGDAFTSAPAEAYAKLDFELNYFQDTQKERILSEEKAGLIDSDVASSTIENLEATSSRIMSNAYLRFFLSIGC